MYNEYQWGISMKKIIIKLLLICYLSATTLAVNAIDLEITNASISPDPLVANTPYVISATFENLTGANLPQDAQFVDVSITGFNLTNIDVGNPIAANSIGWSCSYNQFTNSIDCSQSFSTGGFSPGTTQAFSVQINPGSAVVNPDNFHIEMFDNGLGDETPPNNKVDVPVGVASPNSITITKASNQSSYVLGDDVIYTITVENTSLTDSFFDLEITDVLPANYLDLSSSNVSVVVNNLIGTSTFTCVFGAIIDAVSCDNITSSNFFNPGDRVEIVITTTANALGNSIPNTAIYSSLSFAVSGSSSPALIDITQATPVISPTSLSVQKSVSQNGVQVSEIEKGSSFQYEVVVTNTGNSALYSFSVIDSMPQGVVVDNIVTPAGMTCNNQGQTYSCNYPQSLATNSSLQIIYQVTDASDANTTSLLNTVRVVSFNAQEKSDEVLVDLIGINPNPNSSYTLEINDDVDPVEKGVDYNYTVTLNNTGNTAVNAVDFDIDIPSNLNVNSVVTSGVNCSAISSGLNCQSTQTNFVLNPGQQMEVVTINVISDAFVGDVFVQVSANGSVAILDTETTTIIEPIVSKADLSVAILNTQMVTQGGSTRFDVAIQNTALSAVKPIVSIELSGLIENVSIVQNSIWDCNVNGVNTSCEFLGDNMQTGHSSTIQVNIDLARVSLQSEDIAISATILSTTEDENNANNSATALISVDGTPTEGDILSALRSALDGKANQQVNRAIQNVASYCEVSYFKALEGLCSDLYETALNGDGETINTVMEQITPNEVIGQSTSIAEIATAQFRNIGSRLSQLRAGGGSGFSSTGLNATYGNGSLPIGMLAYLNNSADESSGIDVKNDFISPWGFFVNGTISMGSRDATGRELGFDFDSYGLTAGVDYRLSANKVVGVALGYANFDSDIDGQAKLKSTGLTLTGYGSFYVNDNFYVDARISVAKPDFDQSRKIEFTLGDTTVSRVASGSTSSNQYSVAMSAGYNFYKNSWNITPNGSFRYINTSIDGFTETGAGGFNFNYSNQDLESMIWSAGIRVSKAISLKNGVITPQFDFDYNYESLNDGNDIEARFVTAPLGEVFIIETDSPDRTYGSAGLGFAYISSNGKQAYINYRSVLGLEGFSRGTFNLGARFEF